MRLVYEGTLKPVAIGDIVELRDGPVKVEYFREPHKPSSSGKVTVKAIDRTWIQEFFVSVIGAVWIDREDQR